MTADWARLPDDLLARISNHIIAKDVQITQANLKRAEKLAARLAKAK